jgi:chemotaxis protein methyltransferase CheR
MPGSGEQLSKDLTLAEFRQFRDYIHKHSGIYLEESKLDSLRISLLARATRLDCPGWDAYFEVLARDEAEFRELMSLITINETSFFRFPGQFDALRTVVLPTLASERTNDNRTLRIWSAGCSTGEEPYSIAMTFADSGLESMGWRGEVMGTDVSTKALGVAKAATYPARAVASLSDETIRRHFVRADDSYRVASHPRSMVDFSYHNLIKEPYPLALMGNWDVIFCRNVTIYFKLESTRRVVHNYFNSLNEGGYLFVGHSETLTTISDQFDPVEIGGVFLYRKPMARRLHAAAQPASDRGPARTPARAPATHGTGPARKGASPRREPPARRPVPAPGPAEETPVVGDPGAGVEGLLAEARAHAAEGRPAQALILADRVLQEDSDNTDAYLLAAHVHADAGEYVRALAECERALAVNPLLPGARYLLGVIHQREGDLVHAVSELKRTVYIDADFVLAHVNLGAIYRAEGRNADAVREYENALRALRKNPEGEWTLFLGGWNADVVLRTCERSLLECRKATGTA